MNVDRDKALEVKLDKLSQKLEARLVFNGNKGKDENISVKGQNSMLNKAAIDNDDVVGEKCKASYPMEKE